MRWRVEKYILLDLPSDGYGAKRNTWIWTERETKKAATSAATWNNHHAIVHLHRSYCCTQWSITTMMGKRYKESRKKNIELQYLRRVLIEKKKTFFLIENLDIICSKWLYFKWLKALNWTCQKRGKTKHIDSIKIEIGATCTHSIRLTLVHNHVKFLHFNNLIK